MKTLCILSLLLFSACAASPPQEEPAHEYRLSVTARSVAPDQILVEASLAEESGAVIFLPKVVMLADTRASVYVGDGPVDAQDPDGIDGQVWTDGQDVVFRARVVEGGVERWSGERQVRVGD